jgi:hypothetical protein
MVVVYKPTSAYAPELNTAITKTQLQTGIILSGLRKVESTTVTRAVAGTSSTLLYTVPIGKTFFLTGCMLICSTGAGTTCTGIIKTNLTDDLIRDEIGILENSRTQMPFFMALKFNNSEIFTVYNTNSAGGSTTTVTGIIHGYEIDNTLIPTFI